MPRLRTHTEVIARRGELIVERDPRRRSGRLLRQHDMDASYIDLADPTHLEFDYLRWMRIVLEESRARRVLHVGGGGCALARALAVVDPHGRQLVCEVDPGVLALAREHLGLRRTSGLRVREAEGRAFIAAQPDRSWDAVVIDAFIGASVPRRLVTVQALTDVARVAPLALVNVVDNRAAREVRAIAAGLAAAYPQVWTLGIAPGNTVIAGCAASVGLERIAARTAADSCPARLVEPSRLAALAAATPALRDEDVVKD